MAQMTLPMNNCVRRSNTHCRHDASEHAAAVDTFVATEPREPSCRACGTLPRLGRLRLESARRATRSLHSLGPPPSALSLRPEGKRIRRTQTGRRRLLAILSATAASSSAHPSTGLLYGNTINVQYGTCAVVVQHGMTRRAQYYSKSSEVHLEHSRFCHAVLVAPTHARRRRHHRGQW